MCTGYPVGIPGCINYISISECIECGDYRYLQNNQCTFIEKENRLPNCRIFEDPVVCLRCEKNFLFDSDKNCVKGNAKNCGTFVDKDNCDLCPKGYGLKKDLYTLQMNCVFIFNPNCLKTELVYPFNCITC